MSTSRNFKLSNARWAFGPLPRTKIFCTCARPKLRLKFDQDKDYFRFRNKLRSQPGPLVAISGGEVFSRRIWSVALRASLRKTDGSVISHKNVLLSDGRDWSEEEGWLRSGFFGVPWGGCVRDGDSSLSARPRNTTIGLHLTGASVQRFSLDK